MNNLEDFIGKEVALYPHDTYAKNAILLSVGPHGFVFKITTCETGSGYSVGEVIFISHAKAVTFSNKCKNISK